MPRVLLGNIKPTPPRPVISPSELDFSERDDGCAPLVSYPKSAPARRGSFGCLPRWFTTSECRRDIAGLDRGAKAFDSVMPLVANPRVFDRYRVTLTLSLVACEGGRATFVLITSWHD